MAKFSWEPTKFSEERLFINRLVPDDILYAIDGPTTYTVRSEAGLLLAHWCDSELGISRFVLVPTSECIVHDLESGRRSIYEALDQPWLWIAEADGTFNVARLLRTTITSIPSGIIPDRHVMLSPDLEPAFSLKLSGRELSHDFIPASVIRRAVDGAYGALKKMTEKILDAGNPTGRPADSIREIFDLPMQRIARGSFEVAFGMPRPRQGFLPFSQGYTDCLKDIGDQMGNALQWAISNNPKINIAIPEIELLEAIEKLAPPKHGLVEKSLIGGSLLRGRSFFLTRDASSKIKKTLNSIRSEKEKIVQLSGKVREFDKDKYSFILRETDDGQEYKCIVHEETYDDAYDAFDGDVRVVIVGRAVKLKQYIDVITLTEI